MTNKQIMAVTGHTTEKSLLIYIGKAEIEHIEEFYDVWEESSDLNIKMKKV